MAMSKYHQYRQSEEYESSGYQSYTYSGYQPPSPTYRARDRRAPRENAQADDDWADDKFLDLGQNYPLDLREDETTYSTTWVATWPVDDYDQQSGPRHSRGEPVDRRDRKRDDQKVKNKKAQEKHHGDDKGKRRDRKGKDDGGRERVKPQPTYDERYLTIDLQDQLSLTSTSYSPYYTMGPELNNEHGRWEPDDNGDDGTWGPGKEKTRVTEPTVPREDPPS